MHIIHVFSLVPDPLIDKIDSNPTVRAKAILTLHKLAHGGNSQAVRILHTVYSNPSENYQVSYALGSLIGNLVNATVTRSGRLLVLCVAYTSTECLFNSHTA